MKIFNSAQIKNLDKLTIEREPIASIDLMERAAIQLLNFIMCKFSIKNKIALFAGAGNNGGDAIALARLLSQNQYYTELFIINLGGKFSTDNEININRLDSCDIIIHNIDESSSLPNLTSFDVIIDGIFGSGLNRSVTNWISSLIQHINKTNKIIISIDIPSGLFSEDNTNNTGAIICASYTVSFQFPKLAFMLPENEKFVGKWTVLPINILPKAIQNEDTNYYYTTLNDLPNLKKRQQFSHKGSFGHALLIAGSYGMTGAAILAAKSCLRSGVGLLSVHIPKTAYKIIQSTVPEAMAIVDKTNQIFRSKKTLNKYNCISMGPGIGTEKSMKKKLTQLLTKSEVPLILDADALNIIAAEKSLLKNIPKSTIITPHPKEFDRLTQNHENNLQRIKTAVKIANQYHLTIVLKGAHTSVISPNGNIYFNSTGNPGLAKGGSGDVLTGIILGLVANKYALEDAAKLGVFIHGLAADLAIKHTAPESLIATDVINHISQTFITIRNEQSKKNKESALKTNT